MSKETGQQGGRRPLVHRVLGQDLQSRRSSTRSPRRTCYCKYSLHEPRRGRDDIKAFMTDFRRHSRTSISGARPT